MNTLEITTVAKVTKRLVPFLIVCYFVAYLDRVNVSFAALTMNQDLGLSQTAFGFGAGIFFIAYFIFEVPSNLLLERFGARKWIARIMLSWGILSGLMAFIPDIGRATGLGNENSFYLIRVLLGAAEAGFFPGIIFYLTLWFPSEYRARIVGYFMAAIPLSTVIGAPVSGLLLYLHGGLGLAGWAVAVHSRGDPRHHPRRRRILLSHRPAGRCEVARRRRTRLVDRTADA
jgi:ACS family tartrate transporter-like MFS transporter